MNMSLFNGERLVGVPRHSYYRKRLQYHYACLPPQCVVDEAPRFPLLYLGAFFVQESRLGGTSLHGALFFPFLHR